MLIHHPQQHVTLNLFTQEMDSDHWKFQVWTIGEKGMNSPPVSLNISPDKQKGSEKTHQRLMLVVFRLAVMCWANLSTAELVKDFKCVVDVNRLNCSWIPADPSLNLTVHYRWVDTFHETEHENQKSWHNFKNLTSEEPNTGLTLFAAQHTQQNTKHICLH